jgi:hypothetical protein
MLRGVQSLWGDAMRATLVVFALMGAAACGASTTPAASPSDRSGVTATQPSSEGARSLDENECRSLAQWLADACQNRPNERSARVDGWCSDILGKLESGAWVTGDCEKHIKYMDSVCFRSTTSVLNMMDCDDSVQRQ